MSTKGKLYKLGAAATLFVYAPAGIKILEGQSVEIGPAELKHQYIRDAIASQHIVLAEKDDKSLKHVKTEEKEFVLSKARKDELIAEILKHEDNDLEEDELSSKNKPELVNIYENLYDEDGEEEEDEDEEEDEE